MLSSLVIPAWLRVALGKILPYALFVLFVVVCGWLLYNKGFDNGVQETEQTYQRLIVEERHRQIEANDVALQNARQRQLALERMLDEQEAIITDLSEEAENDPNADRPALGTDSLRRINRIR